MKESTGVKRAFKAILSLTLKKADRLSSRCPKSLFQNQILFILYLLVFQRISKSSGQEQLPSVSYHQGCTLSYFYRALALSLSPVYPTMAGENFLICGFQITEKRILLFKKLKIDILSRVPRQNFPPGS